MSPQDTLSEQADQPVSSQPENTEANRLLALEKQNEILAHTMAEMQTALRQYTDLYDFAPVGYFTLNRNRTILQVNLRGAELLRRASKSLPGQMFDLFVSAESRPIFATFFANVLTSRSKDVCEIELTKNERDFWARLEATYSDTILEEGGICHLMVSDITDQKHAEKIVQARLRITEFAAKHAFSDLLQNALDELCALTDSPIGFFHFVEADQRTLWLQAWSTRTVKEFCTATGKGEHYHIDRAGVWVDCVREGRPIIHNDYVNLPHRKGLPAGHAPVIREMVFPIMRDQKIVAIIGVGNKNQDYTEADVAYASRLADLIWDITERKRAEESLRESEARYRSILEDQSELICRYLPDGRLSYVNEAYARYYGETAQKLINTNFIPNIPEPDLSMIIGKIAGITPQEPVVVYEHRIIKPDGEILWQRWTHRGIYDAAGMLIEHQAVGQDITNRKRTEEGLQRYLSELKVLYDNGLAIGSLLEPHEIGSKIIETLSSNLSWHHIVIRLRRGETDDLELIAFNQPNLSGIEAAEAEKRFSTLSRVDQGLSGWVVQNRKAIRLGNVQSHPRYVNFYSGVHSGIYMPLMVGERAIGCISVESEKEDGFTEQDERLLATLAAQTAIAFDNARLYQDIQLLAKLPAEDPNPVLRVAQDGTLLYVNEAGLRSLKQWDLKIGAVVPQVLQEAILQSMQNNTTQTLDLEHGDRLYAFYVAPISSSGYANLYGHDITESRQMKALRDAETRYHVLFDQSPYGVLLVDPETGGVIEANNVTSKQLGYPHEEFLKLKIADYEAAENPAEVVGHMQKIVNEGSDDFETLHRTKTGELRNVYVWVKALQLSGRVFFYTIFQDITERRRMEKANEAYSREITLLEERQRIASDLHDAVSQTLFSARLTAEALLRQANRQTDSFTRSLTDLHRLVRSAGGEIRLVLMELRNHALANSNLSTLLGNLIDSGMARTNANLAFQCLANNLILPVEVKLAFYRIAQEAISNAIKHGKPENIDCILREEGELLEMIVEDDGCGFMVDQTPDDHFGLQIMRERAEKAGVDLGIDTQPGAGTTITVCWKRKP